MLERQLKSVELEWNTNGEGNFLDNILTLRDEGKGSKTD